MVRGHENKAESERGRSRSQNENRVGLGTDDPPEQQSRAENAWADADYSDVIFTAD